MYFRPERFQDRCEENKDVMIPDDLLPPSDDDSDSDQLDIVVNANRPKKIYTDSDESSDDLDETSEQPAKPP